MSEPGFDVPAALAAAASGDQRAWEAVVSAYSGLVWSVARSYRLSAADAADVFQGTWLRLVEHINDIRDATRLGGWLATTARREALTLIRRSPRDLPAMDVDVLAGTADVTTPTAEEILLRSEDQRTLWRAFGQLSGRCQRLLRMLFADPPIAYQDVSAALGISVGSIGPTRARCLASLAALVSPTSAGSQQAKS